jgi:hypothetical protein
MQNKKKNLSQVESNEVAGKEDKKRARGIRPQTLKATTASESGDEIELLESCVIRSLREDCPDTLRMADIVQKMYQEPYRQILRRDGLLAQTAESKGEPFVVLIIPAPAPSVEMQSV